MRSPEEIGRATVLGSGTMGQGIAQVLAMAGIETAVHDVKEEALAKARATIRANLDQGVEKKKVEPAVRDRSLELLAFSAMPTDRSRGPDLYVWRAGEPRARKLTNDHRTWFASWSMSRIVVSRTAPKTGGVDVRTVLIDPGMGRSHLIECLADVQPDGFVAVPAAHAVRTLLRRRFPKARLNVTVGRRWFWGGRTIGQLRSTSASGFSRPISSTPVW